MKRIHAASIAGILLFVVLVSGCTETGQTIGNEISGLNQSLIQAEDTITQQKQEISVLLEELKIKTDGYKSLEENYTARLEESNSFFDEYQYVESSYGNGYRFFIDSEILHLPVACTHSMEPTIHCDDIVLAYEPESPDEINIGDIVVYEWQPEDFVNYKWESEEERIYEGDYILHRVIAKTANNEFDMKGDNSQFNDNLGYVSFERIRYKVIAIVFNR